MPHKRRKNYWGTLILLTAIDPVTDKKIISTFKQLRGNLYRHKEILIEKIVYETIDFTICKICGYSWSPFFNSEEEYVTHLRLNPHEVVWYFLHKMKWEKRE